MQAWIKAGRGEQVPLQVMFVAMSLTVNAVPRPTRFPPSAGKLSRHAFATAAMSVAVMDAAKRQKLIAARWYRDPKLARHLTERSAVDEAGSPR
jgi:hypothetical protein